jgi:hypothetical protein
VAAFLEQNTLRAKGMADILGKRDDAGARLAGIIGDGRALTSALAAGASTGVQTAATEGQTAASMLVVRCRPFLDRQLARWPCSASFRHG